MRVLRIVPIGSKTGTYGGPYSTALRQTEIGTTNRVFITLLAGFLAGDRPVSTPSEIQAVLVKVKPMVPRVGFRLAFSLSFARSALRLIRQNDVIHITFARESIPLFSTLAAMLLNKTVVLQTHGMIEQKTGLLDRFDNLVTRRLACRASNIIVLTVREREEIVKWAGRPVRTTIVGNSVPDELVRRPVASPLPEAGVRLPEVLCMSRLHPRKRVCDFIEAAAVANRSGINADWVVIGPDDGDLRNLEAQCDRLGHPARFERAVPPEKVYDRLSATDIFVLSASNEPWGNLLAAALALGRVVIVDETAALAPLIRRCGAGIVVATRSAGQIASAVAQVLSDQNLTETLAKNARELAAANFSDTRLAETLLSVWRGNADC